MKPRFGKAFKDELEKASNQTHHFHKKRDTGFDWQDSLLTGRVEQNSTTPLSIWRKVFLIILVMVFFSIGVFRLFHLQIVQGSYSRDLADSNRIQVKIIHAPRGVIYDRNGKILAQNEPGFRLVEGKKISHLSRDQALKLEVENVPKASNLEIDSNRTYAMGYRTAHVLGYVGEITEEELDEPRLSGVYKLGDKIGRSGIEQAYEKVLKGVDGGEIIEVDSSGKKIRTLRKTESLPGQNLILTIDGDLQSTSFDELQKTIKKQGVCCGAIVAQHPQTGEVLSLVSYPSFDPLNVSEAIRAANAPLLNRTIGGVYPPGSTYKIASSLAGLASGKVTESTIVEDTGVISLGPFKFSNWYFTQYGKTEGAVDIVKALKRSNDTFFYRVGEWVGEKGLAEVSKKLGLGKKLGIDIPGEEEGVIPDNNWKVKNIGEVWYPGDSLHMAIGQGFVLSTPLQISNLISTIAADGLQYPPHLVSKITDRSGKTIKEYQYESVNRDFNKDYLKLIKTGLEQVPKNGGTAWPFFTFPIPTAGKTGTAEFGDAKKTHAWYTSYAPADDPKIAVTVLVEAGGEGSSIAAPVVKEIYRNFFSTDKKNLIKDINAPIATDSARTLGE